jgi:hypothetical protein
MSSQAHRFEYSEPGDVCRAPVTCPILRRPCDEDCAWAMWLPNDARACAVAVLAQGVARYDAGAPCVGDGDAGLAGDLARRPRR